MKERRRRAGKRLGIAAALLAAAALLCFFLPRGTDHAPPEDAGISVTLDGQNARIGTSVHPELGALRVYITVNGMPLLELPFGEEHTVRVRGENGGENTVRLTGEAVWMESANCQGQDCVQMGQITRENLEERVMGGFIVCLPHRVSVEVRGTP